MPTLRDYLDDISRLSAEARLLIPDEPEPGPGPDPEPTHVRVTTALELHRALEKGGTIVVAPGDYQGNFLVTVPTVLIEETRERSQLRPEDLFAPPLSVFGSGVRVEGFTVANGLDDRETVVVGSPTQTDPNAQPDDVTFWQTKLIAGEKGGKRGFSLHGRRVSLLDCSAVNYWRIGQDSQALYINNGPGPYLVDGGYYEASGENILLGGDALPAGVNPSAIIRKTTLRKPQEWRGRGYSVKNLFEVKAGVDVTLEDSDLDGCWVSAQAGSPIVITTVDQTGKSPWTQVDRVKILRNRITNCPDGFGVNISGMDPKYPTQPMTDVQIVGNYFADSGGIQVGNAPELALTVRSNSFPGVRSKFLSFYGPAIAALTYVENVTRSGAFGITGDDQKAVGYPALEASVTMLDFVRNVIELTNARTIRYPLGNQLVPAGQLSSLLDEAGKLRDGSAGYGG